MIFVTVGTQGSFDRMIEAVDAWAKTRGRKDVFAQIGPGAEPQHLQWARDLSPDMFQQRLEEADAVVAHAGMGTILSALSLGKPVLVMPRLARLGEHRNEHQSDTTERFLAMGRIAAVWGSDEMAPALDALGAQGGQERISRHASSELLGRLRSFLDQSLPPAE